jgi:hypothetical protein
MVGASSTKVSIHLLTCLERAWSEKTQPSPSERGDPPTPTAFEEPQISTRETGVKARLNVTISVYVDGTWVE